MKMSGNTILVTGGGSGIGRALAEKFHMLGNKLIIAGRNAERLERVAAAHAGMASLPLDISDGSAVSAFAARLTMDFPAINIVINNAGIMKSERMISAPDNLADAEAMVTTNLLGPIRLSSALLPHLLDQPDSAIINISSGLAFVPLASAPTYSATKAAIHSWSAAIRKQLEGSAVQIIEVAPPYVQTELLGTEQASDPAAMPLMEFIDEVIEILRVNPDAEEIIVDRCKPLRDAVKNGNYKEMLDGLAAAF